MLVGLFWAVVMCGLMFSQAAAQDDCNNPNVLCGKNTKKPPTPTPTRTPTRTPNIRRPRPPVSRAAQPAATLQFQWGLLKIDDSGMRKFVSINDIYAPRDRLLLSVKVLQNGYLYVIRHPASDRDGIVIFPSRHYNRGENRVQVGDEVVLPDYSNRAVACWLSPPPPSVGSETVTVILSRKPIRHLPNHASAAVTNRVTVRGSVISEILNAPKQQQSVPGGGVDYNTYFIESTENSERIVETLTIDSAGTIKVAAMTAATN